MQITAVRTLTSKLAAPGLSSNVAGSTATLSWTAPTPTGQSVIAGYRVYKGSTANNVNTLVGTFTSLSTTDTLPGSQFYRVEAFDQFTTGSSSSALQCTPQTGMIKWAGFTGHWMNNNHTVTKNEAINGLAASPINAEISDLIPGIVGYKLSISWSAIDPNLDGNVAASPGMAFINAVLNKLVSMGNYKFFIIVEAGAFSSSHPGTNDDSLIPLPLQQNVGLYGQAGYRVANVTTQPSGVSGWWGGDSNGASGVTYSPRFHDADVMAKYIQSVSALGDILDSAHAHSDRVGGIDFRENSFFIGGLANNGGGAGYSNAAWDTQNRLLCNALLAHWPTSNVVYQNTFYAGGGGPPNGETMCQNFQNFMMNNNRIAPGCTDLIGFSHGFIGSWGGAALIGQQITGSTATVTDHRATVRAMVECEGPDIKAYTFADLLQNAQQGWQAAIVWWTRLTSNAPAANLWPQLKLSLTNPANALIHQDYPGNYP